MKKRTLLCATALALALSLSAQSALDLGSRAALRQLRAGQPAAAAVQGRKAAPARQDATTPVMLRVDDATTNEQLEAEGIIVNARRGNIVFAGVPLGEVERIANLQIIRQMQLPRDVQPKADLARAAVGVDKIQAGDQLPQAYTGKGVVTGIVDGGLDPNNIHFRNEDGTTRVEYLTHIYADQNSASGYRSDWYNSETLGRFSTDDNTAFHGTHTLGIMAGGYRGNVTMAEQGSLLGGQIIEAPNPYYGMAYNSQIVASCGTLQDYFLCLGIENILNYAYDTKQPAVINLSLGSTTGPHDGTGMISQYMALAGKEAIICVAAGNEGDLPITITKTLAEDDLTVQSFIQPIQAKVQTESGTYNNLRYGQVYIYSNDATPFDIKAIIYNQSRGVITFQDAAIAASEAGQSVYYATEGYQTSDTDKQNTNFARAFQGYLGVGAQVDETSGRYYAMVDYFVHDASGNNGNYILGFVVTGQQPGQRIDCFCDGTWTVLDNYGHSDYLAGSQDGTISDMACGDNILVVGSYNTRTSFTALDGKTYHYQTMKAGDISSFTSWGTTIHGDQLPHVCAPGVTVISSLSEPYTTAVRFGSYPQYQEARVTQDGTTYYWQESIGTSMATPVVSGAIALWLEANPNLTIDEVKDIVATTALRDSAVVNSSNPIQWGAGKFDAYAGLQEVLRRTALDNTDYDSRLLVRTADNRYFDLFLAGARSLDATLYSIDGRAIASYHAAGDQLTLDASTLPAGIYVLKANQYTEKIIVK